MQCIECGSETRVIDTRGMRKGTIIRRQRQCKKCFRRFTTYELSEIIVARTGIGVRI